jgi:hypothetical protein
MARPPGEPALLERSGLDINLRHAAGSLTTVAAPMLTGPALDILTRLLEA